MASFESVKPLRFLAKPSQEDFSSYRISGFFEHKPKLDRVVTGIIRNGFQHVEDLNGARVADVFAGVDLSFKKKRKFIEALKNHGRLTVGY